MIERGVKQVIILRKDLNMRKGKMVAQGAHASLKAILDLGYNLEPRWLDPVFAIPYTNEAVFKWINTNFKKITLYVNSEQELLDLLAKALEARLPRALIVDSGLTEFKGVPTTTALAIGPAYDDELDPITGHLPLL